MTFSQKLRPMARIISDVFNPAVSLLTFFIYYSFRHYTFRETAAHFAMISLIMVLPVFIWIFRNVRTGKYSNADVSDRKQRMSLYFFIEAVMAVYLIYTFISKHDTDFIFLFVFILLILLHISNYFIKSSMHTAFNVLVSAFFFGEDWRIGVCWLILTAAVGVSRLILKRHTLAEIFSGAAIAAAVSFVYLFVQIQLSR